MTTHDRTTTECIASLLVQLKELRQQNAELLAAAKALTASATGHNEGYWTSEECRCLQALCAAITKAERSK